MYAPFISPPPPKKKKKNSHPWMIFGDFIPLTSFLKLMNLELCRKAIAATVRIGNTV